MGHFQASAMGELDQQQVRVVYRKGFRLDQNRFTALGKVLINRECSR